MSEKLIEVIAELIDVFMIWVGYLGLRITFLSKKENENEDKYILIRTRRVIGVICLLYGLLPKSVFEDLSILVIFMIIFAYYLDSKELKSYHFSSKEILIKSKKSGFSLFTWDMWIMTIVCFFLAFYYLISIFL